MYISLANFKLIFFQTSAMLSLHRNEELAKDKTWTWDNLVETNLKIYISGLTCTDIELLETSDVMPVIGYYVRQLKALNQVSLSIQNIYKNEKCRLAN